MPNCDPVGDPLALTPQRLQRFAQSFVWWLPGRPEAAQAATTRKNIRIGLAQCGYDNTKGFGLRWVDVVNQRFYKVADFGMLWLYTRGHAQVAQDCGAGWPD